MTALRPRAWRKRAVRSAQTLWSIVLAALVVTGCKLGYENPRYDVGYRRLLVIPFRDVTAPTNQRWYGESNRGRGVTKAFLSWSEDQDTGTFVRGPEAQHVTQNVVRWLNDEIRPRDWQQLLRGVDADLVLVGTITEFRHKQPNDVNIFRGSASMSYRLLDARRGTTVYTTTAPREVRFPKQGETNIPFIDLDVENNVRKVEKGLTRELGQQLGKDLYGYYSH